MFVFLSDHKEKRKKKKEKGFEGKTDDLVAESLGPFVLTAASRLLDDRLDLREDDGALLLLDGLLNLLRVDKQLVLELGAQDLRVLGLDELKVLLHTLQERRKRRNNNKGGRGKWLRKRFFFFFFFFFGLR